MFKRNSTTGDITKTTSHQNSVRFESETQYTAMAETEDSSKAGSNATPYLVPEVTVSEAKDDTSETKNGSSTPESKDTTAGSSQTTAKPDEKAANVDVQTYGQFSEDQITDDEKDRYAVHRSDRTTLDNRRKMSSKRIKQSTSYMKLLEDRVAYLESQIVKWKPDDPVNEKDETLPAKLMRREPNRMVFEDFELARLEEGEHVLDIQIRDPPGVGGASGAGRAERLRINSVSVLKILEKLTLKVFGISYIFLRPFRFLMRHRNLLIGYLEELEKIHGGKDIAGEGDKEKTPAVIYEPGGGVWASSLVPEVAVANITEAKEDMEDLRCLLKFIDEECKFDFDLVRAIKHGGVKKIAFKDIDLLFTAGEEVYSQMDVDNPQAYRVLATTGGRPLRKTEFIPGNHKLYYPLLTKATICEHNQPPNYNDIFRARKDDDGKGESLYRRYDTASPFIIDCYSIDFDGVHLGGVQKQIEIRPYEGEKPVTSLPVYPLKLLPDLEKTRERLLDRGRSFLRMIDVSHKYYEGMSLSEPKQEIQSQVIADPTLALQLNPDWVPKLGLDTTTERDPREANESGPSTCTTLGSQGSFCRKHEDFGIELETKNHLEIFAAQAKLLDEAQEQKQLGDSLIILLPARIFGFVLRSRKWTSLDVTLMHEVPSRKEGFNTLVLPKGHRDLIEALVQTHFRGSRPTSGTVFDREHEVDLIRGKGKGLIILLHGAPGVGKTSTAECVADFTGRPLFAITCGDIGLEAKEVEENLEKYFYLAYKWGCVLLLDEADIFLQKRDKADLRRNSLVSVFSRVLEYYSGILFLTTNRVGMFDEAFKSRIHISLYYPPLDRKAYLAVWDMNLARTQEGKKNIQVDRAEIRGYAKRHYTELKWNGRQIRNAFQTAIALAEFDAKKAAIKAGIEGAANMIHPRAKLTRQKFVKVAKASKDFDQYLREVYSGLNDADIAEMEEVRKDNYPGYPPRRRSPFNRNKEEMSESEEDTSTDSEDDEDDGDSEDEDSENDKKRKKKKSSGSGNKSKKGYEDSEDSEDEEEEEKARKSGKKKSSKR
ncbi:hypothetical protein L873DRAFT_1849319 [Choiromyces venosus 120613-1]|uniref:AAA+ ATPase domain-containing protein n=1 Tax=Choiromyces venosus 120613-1 TaxID=1336337 RepID=A0A3N4IYJ3_9PEZI|nr:hypothetical protein L873DRAFT_1849319 [Choiromyces venosus 120613-1]